MDFGLIMIGVSIAAGISIVLALLLALADRFFRVEVDPRIDAINALLPQVNCGACGFPGCSGLAEALVAGKQTDINCRPIVSGNKEKIVEIIKNK